MGHYHKRLIYDREFRAFVHQGPKNANNAKRKCKTDKNKFTIFLLFLNIFFFCENLTFFIHLNHFHACYKFIRLLMFFKRTFVSLAEFNSCNIMFAKCIFTYIKINFLMLFCFVCFYKKSYISLRNIKDQQNVLLLWAPPFVSSFLASEWWNNNLCEELSLLNQGVYECLKTHKTVLFLESHYPTLILLESAILPIALCYLVIQHPDPQTLSFTLLWVFYLYI